MSVEQAVQRHYTHGALEQTILERLAAAGKDPARLTAADLAPGDEFHIGGRQATMELADEMGVSEGLHLLDVGCGIGGPSRYFAGERRCRVTGIDLTPEYVQVAAALSRRVGLGDMVAYRQASALALPFSGATFDGAYMLHVGMNVADKSTLFHEVRRVLRPGAVFGVYDVMREAEGPLVFPLPWASEPAMSFVVGAPVYREKLEQARFTVVKERSRRRFAIDFFQQMQERLAQGGAPPYSTQIVMGPTAPVKIQNLVTMLERGLISPTELICRAA